MIIEKQYQNKKYSGYYNIGPDECDCVTTDYLTSLFCEKWGEGLAWVNNYDGGPHESSFLKLDCSKIKKTFGWKPIWHIEEAIEKTIEWTKVYLKNGNIQKIMDKQIKEFMMIL